jgi:hypothetical protein
MAWLRSPNTIGPAAVAGSAARRVVFSKVAADQHAAAFGGPCVVSYLSQTPLAFVAKDLELGHEIAHPGLEVLWRHDDADAALFIPRSEPGLLKIRQQHLADPGGHASGVGEVVGCRGALLVGPRVEGGLKTHQMADAGTTEALEVFVDFKVGGVEQEDAVGRMAVAPSAPDLLHVLLERAWSLVM